MKNKFDRSSNNVRYFVGHQIRYPQVLCIDHENVNHGVIATSDALKLAANSGLDLVQISMNGKLPTCKILDFNKFKYEMSKKDKLAKKKQRESIIKVKEIKFRPSTGENDLKIKAKQAEAFIEEGHKVKVTIVFKGREMSHKNVADETLGTFLDLIPKVVVESTPSLNGRNMTVIIAKKTDKA